MSKTLDELIEESIKEKQEKLFKNQGNKEQKEYLERSKLLLKNEIEKNIKIEIKEECIDEIMQEAERRTNQKKQKEKIKELRSLAFQGLFVALVVGVSVNQITDFIGICKGSVNVDSPWPTVFIAVLCLVICFILYAYMFMKSLIELVGKDTEENERDKS